VLNFNLIFVDVDVDPNKNSRYVSLFQSSNVLCAPIYWGDGMSDYANFGGLIRCGQWQLGCKPTRRVGSWVLGYLLDGSGLPP
jgi:hypothetical protein